MQAQGKTISKTNLEICTQAFKPSAASFSSKTLDYNGKGADLIMVLVHIMVSFFSINFILKLGCSLCSKIQRSLF